MVTEPFSPAFSMMRASRWCCLALSTSWGMPCLFNSREMISEESMEMVPTRMGLALAWSSLIKSAIWRCIFPVWSRR